MATKYIAPAPLGSNSNAGTLAAPWETLDYAYTNTSALDTIMCLDGSYSWATATMLNRTISALNIGKAIFTASGGDVTWALTTVSVNGLWLKYNYSTGCPIYGGTFNNCIISDIKFNNTDWTGANFCSGTIMNACLIYNLSGYYSSANGAMFNRASTNYFTNCTIHIGGTGYAIRWMTNRGTEVHYFTNCIIYNTLGTFGLAKAIATTPYPVTVSCYINSLITGYSGSGYTTGDPLFIDLANYNFRLQRTSPCLSTGVLI